MKTITLENFRDDPALREEILARARLERAAFVHAAMKDFAARIKWALQSAGSFHVPGRPVQG